MDARKLAKMQYERHLDNSSEKRIVPCMVSLPKDRDKALAIVVGFLEFAIRDERMNYVTSVGPEIQEVIDLIRRS
jgi:hypothetical protein